MTPDEYLRELAQAITQQEDLNDKEAKDVLYELALRIYALLLRELPEDRLERYMRWRQIRTQIVLELLSVNDQLSQQLYNRMAATELLVSDTARRYFQLPIGAVPPRLLTEVLDTTRVVGVPVSGLFVRNPRTGLTPFVTQLLQLLERSVVGMFFTDPPTPEVAAKVIQTRTSAGRQVPVASKGTVANAWRDRVQSIVAAALWGTVQPAIDRAVAAAAATPTAPQLLQWRWNAVLDPRTCPVCRPLHRRLEAAPDDFPQGPPPLHPRCRCVLIPELS